jgi:hypothetical protein
MLEKANTIALEELIHYVLWFASKESESSRVGVTLRELGSAFGVSARLVAKALDNLCITKKIGSASSDRGKIKKRFYADGKKIHGFIVLTEASGVQINALNSLFRNNFTRFSDKINRINSLISIIISRYLYTKYYSIKYCLGREIDVLKSPEVSGLYPLVYKGRKKRPHRITPEEAFKARAAAIDPSEINQLEGLLKKLFAEKFHFDFFRIRKNDYRQVVSAKRLIQMCKDERWDVEDFLRVQFNWFAMHTHRKPVIFNLCGIQARTRYDDFLRTQGYVLEDEELDVQRRKKELTLRKAQRTELELLARCGLLYSQFIARLERYLEEYRKKLDVNKLEPVCLPGWLGLSEEKLRERSIEKEVAKERHRIIENFHRRERDRTRLHQLILVEMETGKKSPVINGIDIEKYGLPESLVKAHKEICSGDSCNQR